MSDENDILAAYGRPPDEVGRQMSIDLARAQIEVERLTKEVSSLRAALAAAEAALEVERTRTRGLGKALMDSEAALREARAALATGEAGLVAVWGTTPEKVAAAYAEAWGAARCADELLARALAASPAAATPPETGPGEGGTTP